MMMTNKAPLLFLPEDLFVLSTLYSPMAAFSILSVALSIP